METGSCPSRSGGGSCGRTARQQPRRHVRGSVAARPAPPARKLRRAGERPPRRFARVSGILIRLSGQCPAMPRRALDAVAQRTGSPHSRAGTGTSIRGRSIRKAPTGPPFAVHAFGRREGDIGPMTDAEIRQITGPPNATPRDCPGWTTPAGVFAAKLVEVTGRRSRCPRHRTPHFGWRLPVNSDHGPRQTCQSDRLGGKSRAQIDGQTIPYEYGDPKRSIISIAVPTS